MNNKLIKNCVCCENSDFKLYSSNSYLGFPVLQCSDCGLLVSGGNENEMRKKANEIYEKHYWDERKSEDAIKSNFTDFESKQKRKKWISQIKFCNPFFSNKKTILEIGSGAGHSLYWFQERGFTVMGVEPDKRNVKLISKKLSNRNTCMFGFAEEFQTDRKFDVVWMSHVLEHTVRPDIILKKNFRHAKQGGFIIHRSSQLWRRKNPPQFHRRKSFNFPLYEKIVLAISK